MGKINGCSKSVKYRQHEAGRAVPADSLVRRVVPEGRSGASKKTDHNSGR